MYFTITDSVVKIYSDDNSEHPMIEQPWYPNKEVWTDEEASIWATQYIKAMTDETANFPGPSRDLLTVPRPAIVAPDEVLKNTELTGVTQQMLDDIVASKVSELLAK